MTIFRGKLILLFSLLTLQLFAQKTKKSDKALAASLRTHISFLADDKLEGRRAGSNGEKLAKEYIAAQFKAAGLEPKGSEGFF